VTAGAAGTPGLRRPRALAAAPGAGGEAQGPRPTGRDAQCGRQPAAGGAGGGLAAASGALGRARGRELPNGTSGRWPDRDLRPEGEGTGYWAEEDLKIFRAKF